MKFFGHPSFFGVDVQWIGKLGVMFFFVHTALVLMMSLERSEPKLSGRNLIGNFYLRRIFRIYPLSTFVITAILVLSIPSANIDGRFSISILHPTKKELIANYLLLQNFHMKSILAVLWSLPFEVQMYVLLPFIYLFAAKKNRLNLLYLLWLVSAATAYLIKPHELFVAHFTAGIIAYTLLKRRAKATIPAWIWPLFLLALAASFLFTFPSFQTGSVVCLVLGIMLPFFGDLQNRSVNAITYSVAKYSYGVYLSHMFCLWFAYIYIRSASMFVRSGIFAVLLVALPVALFHSIESPMIRMGNRLSEYVFRVRQKLPSLDTPEGALESTASGL
jgi:peptidoglycan/LPS O-acetylase OafA/YrhL